MTLPSLCCLLSTPTTTQILHFSSLHMACFRMPLLPAPSYPFPLNITNQLILPVPLLDDSFPCSKALSIHQIELRYFNVLNKHLSTVSKLLLV